MITWFLACRLPSLSSGGNLVAVDISTPTVTRAAVTLHFLVHTISLALGDISSRGRHPRKALEPLPAQLTWCEEALNERNDKCQEQK